MFTSSSVDALAPFGSHPLPCSLSGFLQASRHFLAWPNSLSSVMLTRYLPSFKNRLTLEKSPRRLDDSKSSPSFRLTLKINSHRYLLSSSGFISSSFLVSSFCLRKSLSRLTSRRFFPECFCSFFFFFLYFVIFIDIQKGLYNARYMYLGSYTHTDTHTNY